MSNLSRYLFLDIDGVLNTDELLIKHGIDFICDDRVAILKKIIDSTGAFIVLSSDWRRKPEDRELVKIALAKHGLEFIDCTPFARKMSQFFFRYQEISMWLEDKLVTKFAIIDDLDDACIKGCESSFFQTDDCVGLTTEIANKIIEHFNS